MRPILLPATTPRFDPQALAVHIGSRRSSHAETEVAEPETDGAAASTPGDATTRRPRAMPPPASGNGQQPAPAPTLLQLDAAIALVPEATRTALAEQLRARFIAVRPL